MVLVRDLRAAVARLNPDLPPSAQEQAIEKLTRIGYARSLVQHNREFYGFIRGGVPVDWREPSGELHRARAQVIDFRVEWKRNAEHEPGRVDAQVLLEAPL